LALLHGLPEAIIHNQESAGMSRAIFGWSECTRVWLRFYGNSWHIREVAPMAAIGI
jgi:hypothetical protein